MKRAAESAGAPAADAKAARQSAGEEAAAKGEAADSEDEEGEIVEAEEQDASARAAKAWVLDLSRPPAARIVRSPLGFACEKGRPVPGLWLEFGVYSGQTANLMAVHAPGKVFGFDTFTGLPEDWRDSHKKGHFNLHGHFPPVKDNVELVAGLFQDTLVPFLERHPGDKLAVAHLDADLYSATIYALRELAPRVVPGTLLVFDELINFDGYQLHEWKALLEATHEFGWEVEFIAQSGELKLVVENEIAETQQVALRVTKVRAGR